MLIDHHLASGQGVPPRVAALFKVRADGNLYILRHRDAGDEWSLESFRRLQ
jgi:hypothetical protein